MFIGARILKTGLGVILALLICKALGIEPAIFAAITVVVNMQASVGKALRNAWEQLAVHVSGVVLAIVAGYLFGTGPFVIGLAVVLIIAICTRIGWSAITLGVVSVIFILDSPPDEFLYHAGIRSAAVFIGLGVALAVNRILAPPKYKEKFLEALTGLFQDTSGYFLDSLHTFINATSLESFIPREAGQLRQKLDEVEELYEHARGELLPEENPAFLERVLEIGRGFVERGQSINEITYQRIQRRSSSGSPVTGGISPEFSRVLEVMSLGQVRLEQLVRKTAMALRENGFQERVEEDNEEYWIQFNAAIDEWQKKFSGVFYLRALMEVAVVAIEIRWAARKMKSLYSLKQKKVERSV